MAVNGFGFMREICDEFNKIQIALETAYVIQKDSTAGVGFMRIRDGKWSIHLGE